LRLDSCYIGWWRILSFGIFHLSSFPDRRSADQA